MSGSFDVTGLNRLAEDLGALALGAHGNIRTAVAESADAVRKAWNAKLYTDGHAKMTRGSISTTVTEGIHGVGADIGPRRGYRQAGIVLLLEVGSVNNAPHGYGTAAVTEEEAGFAARITFGILAAQKEHGLE